MASPINSMPNGSRRTAHTPVSRRRNRPWSRLHIPHPRGRKRLGRTALVSARHEIPGRALWLRAAPRQASGSTASGFVFTSRRGLSTKHPAHAARHGARGHDCRAQRPRARETSSSSASTEPPSPTSASMPATIGQFVHAHASRLSPVMYAPGRRLYATASIDGGEAIPR